VDVGVGERSRIGAVAQAFRFSEFARFYLAGAVMSAGEFGDARRGDVETERVELAPERGRERQADVTEADHGNPGAVEVEIEAHPCRSSPTQAGCAAMLRPRPMP